ncbi:MAG: cysteine hydrolase family protein [Gemmatimonadota bacterium]
MKNLPGGKRALLVIDVQEGMFTLEGFRVHGAADFLSRVSDLILSARSAGVQVVYVQHCGPSGSALERGTEGCRIHASIAPLKGELVIQKLESDAFLGTTLHEELQARGVTDLIVCGMQSEFCVDTTCRRAHGLGYRVTLVEDAHTTGDTDTLTAEQIIAHHNETLARGFVTLSAGEDVFSPP